jgi:short-subunit dehydrogenase
MLDITKPEQIEAFAHKMHGIPIDLLINNAGIKGKIWSSCGYAAPLEFSSPRKSY